MGSDHTDRKVETCGVTVSKQMRPKPVSRELWNYDKLEDHWDELMLRSWVARRGKRELYQQDSVTKMLAPRALMERYLGKPGVLPAGTAMYCGTPAVTGESGGGERFEIEFEDPRLKRKLQHAYAARVLEIAD